MRLTFPRLVSPLAAILLAAAALPPPALAQGAKGNLHYIPDSDGYGINECFAPGAACGRVVADAWCEAHGQGKALAFGRAEDVTAAIEVAASTAKAPKGAFVVSCAD